MYDHLPPRLAKYLAAIYTGTDVQEIERQDTESIIEAKIKAWRCFTKLSRWNKQRGQKINQLNKRIHEQRQTMRNKNKQIEVLQDAYMGLKRRLSEQEDNSRLVSVAHKKIVEQLLEDNERNRKASANIVMHQEKQLTKVTKWNNAHKREIAQLQSKLHDRRVEVRKLNAPVDDMASNTKLDAALFEASDLRHVLEMRCKELADWYGYVQLLIAELNKRDEKIEALEEEYASERNQSDLLESMLYDRDWEFK